MVKTVQEKPLFLDCFTLKLEALCSFRNVGCHQAKATDLYSRDFDMSDCVKFGLSLF